MLNSVFEIISVKSFNFKYPDEVAHGYFVVPSNSVHLNLGLSLSQHKDTPMLLNYCLIRREQAQLRFSFQIGSFVALPCTVVRIG